MRVLSCRRAGVTIRGVVIEERARIAATPGRVWAVVADPDRMAELSPEVRHIEWAGDPGPRPGGHVPRPQPGRPGAVDHHQPHRDGRARQGIRLAHQRGRDLCVSRWSYRIAEQPEGCEVLERYEPVGWMATAECLLGRGWMLRRGMRATLRRLTAMAESSAQSARRAEIHQDLDAARTRFHDLLGRTDRERLRAPTNGTAWTNEELLFHMLFGYLVVRTSLPLVRAFGQLPPGVNRRFAAALNAATGPFDVVNYYGSKVGARLVNHRRMGPVFDRVIASLHRRLDTETDATLDAQMSFPTRWDPFFRPVMTAADVYHYAGQHFEFHRHQLRLDASGP
jgi:hypothetical protein